MKNRNRSVFAHEAQMQSLCVWEVAVILGVAGRKRPATRSAHNVLSGAEIGRLGTLLALEFGPSLHSNLTTVKFTLVLNASLLNLVSVRLTRVTP